MEAAGKTCCKADDDADCDGRIYSPGEAACSSLGWFQITGMLGILVFALTTRVKSSNGKMKLHYRVLACGVSSSCHP